MKFLDDVKISLDGYSPSLFVRLKGEWKEAAPRFPKDRLPALLKNEIDIANRVLHDAGLEQSIEIRIEEDYGLSGLSLSPDRAGIDLQAAQDSYVSHNLSTTTQAAALLPIILKYTKYLEHV